MNANIQVYVRVRPALEQDQEREQTPAIDVEGASVSVKGKHFAFDTVFEQNATQQEVFDCVAPQILQSFFAGFSGTIFAYGQTASGKTFTLGHDGIIQRSLEYIFDNLSDHEDLSMSYYEIYNEQLYDLLFRGSQAARKAHTAALLLREADDVYVENLMVLPIKTRNAARKLLETGLQSRQTARTQANDKSSRSHAVLTFYLREREDESLIVSKLNIVDLAGSERMRTESIDGKQFKEMVGINEGLLCLGNVISALNEHKKHVPYRNSKLTRVLQDSIGGSARCAMIACVNPAQESAEETVNTLIYAARAKSIVNVVRKKVFAIREDDELIKLREENELLKDYIENLVFERKEDIMQYDNVLQENIELKSQIGLISGEEAASLKDSIRENVCFSSCANEFYSADQLDVIDEIIDSKIEMLQQLSEDINANDVINYLKSQMIGVLAKEQVDFVGVDSTISIDGLSVDYLNKDVELLAKAMLLVEMQKIGHSFVKLADNGANMLDQQRIASNICYQQSHYFEIAQKYAEFADLREYLRFRSEGHDLDDEYELLRERIDNNAANMQIVPYLPPEALDDQAEVIELDNSSQTKECGPFLEMLQNGASTSSETQDGLDEGSKMARVLQDVQKKVEQMTLGQLEQYVIDRTAPPDQEISKNEAHAQSEIKCPYHSPNSLKNSFLRSEPQHQELTSKSSISQNDLHMFDLQRAIEEPPASISQKPAIADKSMQIHELDDKFNQLADYYYSEEDKVKQHLQQLLKEQKILENKKQRTPQAVSIKSQIYEEEAADEAFRTPLRASEAQKRRDQDSLIPTQPRTPLSQRLLKRKPIRE